jgi:proline iminopeptidase
MTSWKRDEFQWTYPAIEPYSIGRLKVSDVHQLYFEESGNPNGKPVVFVHGGPGAGTDPNHRRFFHPEKYRIILFDQRGSGKSTPHASLEDNTTWHLVEDMEVLRKHLGIETWQVFGGSWGSTLGLAYAQTHPNRVSELVLRGIFLLRKKEINWLYQYGACEIFPEAWQPYWNKIPESERGDMLSAYYKRLTSPDRNTQIEFAKPWSQWEGATSKLFPDRNMVTSYGRDDFALAFARIEAHYFYNKGWFKSDDQLLADAHKIRHIPGVIVHGRYDVVCPIDNAFALKQVWPEADLFVVPDAGHSAFEPGISRALVSATDRFADWKTSE